MNEAGLPAELRSPVPPPRPPLSRATLAVLFFAPMGFTVLAYGAALLVFDRLAVEQREAATAPAASGAALFAQHCASCHGITGDGRGVAHLEPRARAFGADKFKLATTLNGVPTDDDLLRVLKRGIPGSAMPAFAQPADGAPASGAAVAAHLTDDQLRAVIGHVRELTRAGVYADIRRKIEKAGDEDFDPARASQRAAVLSQPGEPLAVPTVPVSAAPDRLANGKAAYLKNCAQCHGPEGKGDGPQVKDMKNEDGTPNRPRDFTAGVYKGGKEPAQLYARIRLGIPGTPMPATPVSSLPDADAADLISYVLSLSERRADGVAAR